MIRLLSFVTALLLMFESRAEDNLGHVDIFVSIDCPIANAYAPELSRIHHEFSPVGFDFYLIYPDPTTTAEDIEDHRREYFLNIPGMRDPNHERVKTAGASITPEVAVFDSKDKLLYRGQIDNLFNAYGDKRRAATKNYLRNILKDILEGKDLSFTQTVPIGCFIEPIP